MKWIKFDPSNPPKYTSGIPTFWIIRFSFAYHYYTGAYLGDKGLLIYAGDKDKIDVIISPDELRAYNAHYIYPQDLEMPE